MGDSDGSGRGQSGGGGGIDVLSPLAHRFDGAPLPGPSRSKPLLLCQHCTRSFSKPSKLEEHLRSHSSERSFPCPHPSCSASYKRNDHLQRHVLRSHSSAPLSNPGTPTTTQSPAVHDLSSPEGGSRASSVGLFDPARPFVCTFVPAQSTSTNAIPCGRRFWSKQHLQRHLEGFHDVEPAIEHETGDESKNEASGEGRSGKKRGKGRHRAGGQGAYACDQPGCDAVFSKRKQLRSHIWEAHSELHAPPSSLPDQDTALKTPLPFRCSHEGCGKLFATNAKRRTHMKTHKEDRYTCFLKHAPAAAPSSSPSYSTNSKPPISSERPMRFATWTALQKHMREAHPPTCPYPRCKGKTFARPENLRLHLKRHEDKARELARAGRMREEEGEDECMELEEEDDYGDDEEDDGLDSSEEEDDHRRRRQAGSASSKAPETPRDFICGWLPPTSTLDGPSPPAACSKTFKSAYARSKHISVHHERQRPFVCPAAPRCSKSYGHKHLLKRHLAKCKLANRLEKEANVEDGPEQGEGTDADHAAEVVADNDDEEDEDAYFMREGGAVPGEDSERGPTREARRKFGAPGVGRKRKRGVDTAKGNDAHRFLELLTGRGYGQMSVVNEGENQDRDDAIDEGRKKRRRMRGRVVACPWSRIAALRRATKGADEGGEIRGQDPVLPSRDEQGVAPTAVAMDPTMPAEGDSEAGDSDVNEEEGDDDDEDGLDCAFRFSRLYDLRRHLASKHGLELDDTELRALIPKGERERLAKPRRKKEVENPY